MASKLLKIFWRVSPLLLTFVCTGAGFYLFKDVPPEILDGNGVTPAGFFRTAVLVLLCRVKIYPSSLKKLGRCVQMIIEFVLSMFIVEHLQARFWRPLQMTITRGLLSLGVFADNLLQLVSINDSRLCETVIGNEWTACFVVYLLSLFFFICALHGTKAIDLRHMKYGPEPFIYAILEAYRKFLLLMCAQKIQGCRAKRYYSPIQKDTNLDSSCDVNQQKSIEWKKSNDDDLRTQRCSLSSYDDNCSDFEMDCDME